MRGFVASVEAVEHHLPSEGNAAAFLKNWRTVVAGLRIADDSVWKSLQNGKAGAGLELESCSRCLARRGPAGCAGGPGPPAGRPGRPTAGGRGAPGGPGGPAALGSWRSSTRSRVPVKVRNLPDRARGLVRRPGRGHPPPGRRTESRSGEPSTRRPRPVRRIRVATYSTSGRIHDLTEWAAIRDNLERPSGRRSRTTTTWRSSDGRRT